MKKLLSIFSLGVLLFSSLAPSFTYANADIEELTSLLNLFLEETSNEHQETITQIRSTPETKTFWVEEVDEIEYINNNQHFVWNKTKKIITAYSTDFSYWISYKDRNEWSNNVWEIWGYYQRWNDAIEDINNIDYSIFNKNERRFVDDLSDPNKWRDPINHKATDILNRKWNCDDNYHIPSAWEFKQVEDCYWFQKYGYGDTNLVYQDILKMPYWWYINRIWENQWQIVTNSYSDYRTSGTAWWSFWQDSKLWILPYDITENPNWNNSVWAQIRCFKDNYLETLTLKIWDETILTQFEHWESFDKSLTWQLLSNIDIPEWYHVEWYITWDNNELTWFDFDNEEITTTMTLIWEVVNDNNWIFDLGNWIRKVVWNNKSIKYDTNLIGWIQWWANASWEPYSNDNNAWWWANDDIDNQFWAWNNWFWRQWPCQDWWHVASNWEWKTLVNYSCYNNPNCNPKENINDDYWSPIILSNYSNRQSLLWFNLEAWRAIRTSSFISWINFVWIGNNYIEVYDTVVQNYYINYRNTNVNANIPKNAPINVLCIDNYYATITFKNKKDETIIIDSISDIEKDKKINLNQLPEQEEWYTNHYYLKNNGEFEEIENILELIITSDLDIYVESVQNIIPSEPDLVSSPVSHTSGWSGRPISTTKQETKVTEQEHNSADIQDQKTTNKQTNTSTNNVTTQEEIKQQVKKVEDRSLTRWEIAIMTNILLEVYPQLVEWKQELDDVNKACSNYADEQNFTKDEKKAITRLCKLSIMWIHNDTNKPLEEFLANNNATNDEFSKVINRSIENYNEKDLSTIKEALKKLEWDEENVVFGTVYDVFMSIKSLFN